MEVRRDRTNQKTLKMTEQQILKLVDRLFHEYASDYRKEARESAIEMIEEYNETELFKPKKFSFKNSLLEYGAEKDLVDDWLQVRKDRRASNTKTAFNSFITQVEKTDRHINDILKICIDHSWKGFYKKWLENLENNNNGNTNSNRFNNNSGNTKGSFSASGKISATTILAKRINQQSARNSESGTTTVDVEIL